MSLKVAHLSSAHPPDDTRIYLKECLSLATVGFEVSLVARQKTGFMPTKIAFQPIREAGSRWERMSLSLLRVYRAAIALDADVYHFHDPELIPVGLMLKLRGKKVVYDVHEDYSKSILERDWIPSWIRVPTALAAGFAEQRAARCFDLVVTATPSIHRRHRRSKHLLVQNFPIESELLSEGSADHASRPPHFVYVGAISRARGVLEMIDALSLVEVAGVSPRLELVGAFESEALLAEAKKSAGWKFVDFHGSLGRKDVAKVMARGRAGVVLFHPEANHIESQPNKLFEYLSAGLPVIASHFPLWRQIVEEEGVGLCVDPLDARAISSAMEQVLKDPERSQSMGAEGLRKVRASWNWEAEAKKLTREYQSIASKLLTSRVGNVPLAQ